MVSRLRFITRLILNLLSLRGILCFYPFPSSVTLMDPLTLVLELPCRRVYVSLGPNREILRRNILAIQSE
jgi:hypothetical protein